MALTLLVKSKALMTVAVASTSTYFLTFRENQLIGSGQNGAPINCSDFICLRKN
jgi:hypothetical protein